MKENRNSVFANMLLLFFFIILLTFIFEFTTRELLEETMYLPGPKIEKVQSYLRTHSSVGFLWKRNINYSDSVMLPWTDQVVTPLSTDSDGFRNFPSAILSEQKINIIGLGDSFMHDASYILYNYFSTVGSFYYNMAMHRHSPPQYNIILKEYAIDKKPDWIVYGIFENDFEESIDFFNWKNSKLDWFEFHSGIWGGPETIDKLEKPYLIPFFKGSYAFIRLVYDKFKRKFSNSGDNNGVEIVSSCIKETFWLAQKNSIKFLLLLIPSKKTMHSGKSKNYNNLLKKLKNTKITIIDLRKYFNEHSDIDKYYYKTDGHWNKFGILETAKIINSYIQKIK